MVRFGSAPPPLPGRARRPRLLAVSAPLRALAEDRYRATGEKHRLFGEARYGARAWDAARRVIVKAEHGPWGGNPRFVVTSLEHDPQRIYDRVYCARSDMENRIKEQQLDLFADRTSCRKWWANQFRLLLSSLAYTLLETIRRTALRGTALARAQCGTLRLKLLRIGAVVLRNTRRVRLLLSSSYPHPELFLLARPAASMATPCGSGVRSPATRPARRNRRKSVPERTTKPRSSAAARPSESIRPAIDRTTAESGHSCNMRAELSSPPFCRTLSSSAIQPGMSPYIPQNTCRTASP